MPQKYSWDTFISLISI